jgi:general secretion pathway protein A
MEAAEPPPTADSALAAAPIEPPAVAKPDAADTGFDNLESYIRANPAKTDTKAAFKSLFTLWDTEFTDDGTRACDYAQQVQLYCLLQKGSLAQLETLNRPAILSLRDYAGGLHQIVLAQIAGDNATVYIGDEQKTLPLADVIELWYGDFLLLWKPQIGKLKSFYPGMSDPDVVWLRYSLATIQGTPVEPMDSEYFDAELEARVKEFQVAHRLDVDGLVGQQTQIMINSDLATGTPRLMRAD